MSRKTDLLVRILLATLSGFLLGMSFPDKGHFLFAWCALAPLLVALYGVTFRTGFFLSWLTGFLFFSTIYLWGWVFGGHVWFALSLWQGFYFGLWGGFAAWALEDEPARPARLFLPVLLFVFYEYGRSLGPLGINWGAIAYSQYEQVTLIQVAGITGMYGISFLVMLGNMVLAWLLITVMRAQKSPQGDRKTAERKKGLLSLALSFAALMTVTLAYGHLVIAGDSARKGIFPRVKVSIVQPSVDMLMKWDNRMLRWTLETLTALSAKAAQEGTSLVFWPETSVPTFIPNNTVAKEYLEHFTAWEKIYFAAGAPQAAPDGRKLNTVFLFSPQGKITAEYSKRHIVPFGEYLPFRKHLRKYSVFDRVQDFSSGDRWTLFPTPWGSFSVLICFESDFPGIARVNVRNGATFLAVLTNDAWFERSSAAVHHLGWSVFRAVENHSNVVQAANTGVSAFIDPHGKIRKKSEIYTRVVLTDDLVITPAGTFYTRHGNVFLLIAALPAFALALRRSRERQPSQAGKSKGGKEVS
ncbi:MAG: apolipoprotein N-acyltransferase [Candidatus Eremiobacteraeota bacterium]|nr:apolipoprotein N-acyltransferase [Candidatus Eremiobacteraeota bacterium]